MKEPQNEFRLKIAAAEMVAKGPFAIAVVAIVLIFGQTDLLAALIP
ncbi:hypothetical protein ACQKP1_17240 [Allorhizobium sp. NPDC080224]|jgi:hypothetical protein|nr:hypothetical protein [Rhizobium rosettiformans]